MAVFHFKHFDIDDCGCGMKICSDSVLLAAWLLPGSKAGRVLDVGAGSGVISLLAADILPSAHIAALEIDPVAAQTARHNFSNSPWNRRLELVECNFMDYSPPGQPDIIISNPPYFSNGAVSDDICRAKARHQSELTYGTLIDYAATYLAKDGILGFVSPCDGMRNAEDAIICHAEMSGLKLRRLCRVATSPRRSPTRLLWQFSRSDGSLDVSRLDMRYTDGSYTDEYRQLVEHLYKKI